MLVLTRKPSEEILIGGNIRVRVVKVDGSKVRIGIDAPPQVLIRRGELEEHWRPETSAVELACAE